MNRVLQIWLFLLNFMIVGRSKDLGDMNAEIDGRIFSDGHLHRKWYNAKRINVVKKLCERE